MAWQHARKLWRRTALRMWLLGAASAAQVHPAAAEEPTNLPAAPSLIEDTDDAPEPAGQPRADTVAINLAPAVCGLLVLQWEHRFIERFSAVLIGGAGIGSSLSSFADMTVLEVGAQVRGYAVATHAQAAGLAVEAMAGWIPSDPHRDRRGLAISPRLVYRIMASSGLTTELQVGMAWTQRSAMQVGTGATVTASSGPSPIHAVVVGYSF